MNLATRCIEKAIRHYDLPRDKKIDLVQKVKNVLLRKSLQSLLGIFAFSAGYAILCANIVPPIHLEVAFIAVITILTITCIATAYLGLFTEEYELV